MGDPVELSEVDLGRAHRIERDLLEDDGQHVLSQQQLGNLVNVADVGHSKKVPKHIINKVSMFSIVPKESIIGVPDVSNIYQVPQLLLAQNMLPIIFKEISLDPMRAAKVNLTQFNRIAHQLTDKELAVTKEVSIGIVGKYTGLNDAYLSITKALLSAALACGLRLQVVWIESSDLESDENVDAEPQTPPPSKDKNSNVADSSSMISTGSTPESTPEMTPEVEEMKDTVHNISIYNEVSPQKRKSRHREYRNAWNKLRSVNGILIPGGFGDRGIEGKIAAVNYARTEGVPFLGICLGMQMAVTEFCRNVLGLEGANSTEFDSET